MTSDVARTQNNNRQTIHINICGFVGGKISIVAVCTNLSGRNPYRQVGVDIMVTSGRLDG